MTKENLRKSHTHGPDDPLVHDEPVAFPPLPTDEEDGILSSPALVAEALKQILESEHFRTSTRRKQFLRYVVRYRLENHPEPLKERMIGAALFNRPLDYATGDDSVVRAQAREVRRRLEKYYAAHGHENQLRIDLPVGSYTPEFKLDVDHKQETGEGYPPSVACYSAEPQLRIGCRDRGTIASRAEKVPAAHLWYAGSACLPRYSLSLPLPEPCQAAKSSIAQFWAPALTSSKPLLICLPSRSSLFSSLP